MKKMSLKEKLEYENELINKKKDIVNQLQKLQEKYDISETIHFDRFRELVKLLENEETIENLEKLNKFFYDQYCYQYDDYPKLDDGENDNKIICRNYYEHLMYEFECIPLIKEYNKLYDKAKLFSDSYYEAKRKYTLLSDPQTTTSDKVLFVLFMVLLLIPVIFVIATWGKGDWLFKIITRPLAIFTGLMFLRRFNTNLMSNFVRKKLLNYTIKKRDLLEKIIEY